MPPLRGIVRSAKSVSARMLESFRRTFRNDWAIDLGSATLRIAAAGKGLVVAEPSLMAVVKGSHRPAGDGQAIGFTAQQILGREPAEFEVVAPIREGAIADDRIAELMLRGFFRRLRSSIFQWSPRIVVALPASATPVERRVLFQTLYRAGARRVFGWSKGLAAAVGLGLPIGEPSAWAVCDIGAETTEIAVVSLGRPVAARGLRFGGRAFDQALADHLRRNRRLRVGLPSLEQFRIEHGTARSDDEQAGGEIAGIDSATGLPRCVLVSRAEFAAATAEPVRRIGDAIRQTLEELGIEPAADVARYGLILCGGASQLDRLDQVLADQLGVPVRRADQPEEVVIRGLLACAERLDDWKPSLTTIDDI